MDRLKHLKSQIEEALPELRKVQAQVRELRARGMRTVKIKELMLRWGFGAVNLDQLLSAETVEDAVRLFEQVGGSTLN